MIETATQNTLTVGALAAAAGVGVETVRYYQRRRLLETPKAANGYRRYGEAHLKRLGFIKRAQAIGFTLDEVAELLSLNDSRDHRIARALAKEKILDIEGRIAELDRMADALRRLVRVCAHGGEGMPCPIINMMDS
ncbi:MAG: MerR family DNA-binding protein [Burkholderiaceae bacterium]|nr:MerR family DNA-binding protein [Sulfuritalea sp.]MCF8174639.1 MerR family DNA-binding protein [Burkholderiaceae bacterium]